MINDQLAKTYDNRFVVGESSIKPSESVQNLVGKTCRKGFHGLYNIRQNRKFLNIITTKTLVQAFVSSHLDYRNALRFGLPKYQIDRLKKV